MQVLTNQIQLQRVPEHAWVQTQDGTFGCVFDRRDHRYPARFLRLPDGQTMFIPPLQPVYLLHFTFVELNSQDLFRLPYNFPWPDRHHYFPGEIYRVLVRDGLAMAVLGSGRRGFPVPVDQEVYPILWDPL